MDEILKVSDVRSRGRGFTLFKAAEQLGVNQKLADDVLHAIYCKAGMFDKNGYYLFDSASEEQKNQPMAMQFESGAFSESFIKEAIENGIITEGENCLELTEKMKNVLKKAAEIQKKLDAENFYSRPCNH